MLLLTLLVPASGNCACLPSSLQMLPLVPPDSFWSPYSGLDALCGNPLLIPLNELAELGLLEKGELPAPQPVESQAGSLLGRMGGGRGFHITDILTQVGRWQACSNLLLMQQVGGGATVHAGGWPRGSLT